jgi:hypothetical protein
LVEFLGRHFADLAKGLTEPIRNGKQTQPVRIGC